MDYSFISVRIRVVNIYSIYSIYNIYMKHISIPGAPKKKSFQFKAFARLFDEEKETNNAEIPQVLTFILLSAGLRLYRETCVVGSEKTHEDEGSTSWI